MNLYPPDIHEMTDRELDEAIDRLLDAPMTTARDPPLAYSALKSVIDEQLHDLDLVRVRARRRLAA
jgi:hypothetical protein